MEWNAMKLQEKNILMTLMRTHLFQFFKKLIKFAIKSEKREKNIEQQSGKVGITNIILFVYLYHSIFQGTYLYTQITLTKP